MDSEFSSKILVRRKPIGLGVWALDQRTLKSGAPTIHRGLVKRTQNDLLWCAFAWFGHISTPPPPTNVGTSDRRSDRRSDRAEVCPTGAGRAKSLEAPRSGSSVRPAGLLIQHWSGGRGGAVQSLPISGQQGRVRALFLGQRQKGTSADRFQGSLVERPYPEPNRLTSNQNFGSYSYGNLK